MRTILILILLCMAQAACRQETASPTVSEGAFAATEAPAVAGKKAYDQACAACHESGLDGAPRTDHPEDWVGRSRLWQAVLYEHANKGYMDMPAKGGDDRLNDAVVAAAAEYMLERTHPDLPVD
ncbi:MAG: hypothetical protein HKN59_06840 [Gammaproteobacteria bacterium]|nr:hypothetical protein [Gammaproteobacteria bacterium]